LTKTHARYKQSAKQTVIFKEILMIFRLLPREEKFFDMFDMQADKLVVAANLFYELASEGKFNDDGIQSMRDLEHECDAITHDIIDKLNRTFITPFDREDIHSFAHELDNVVDMLYTTSKRLRLYKLNKANSDLIQFSDLIVKSVTALSRGIKGLRNHKNPIEVNEACIEINQIENQGDQLRDAIILKLFEKTKDPIKIIKWKEIFESVETVLDICEDIANLMDSILVKQG
jgi:predicted phosphate transport protein (TIGR00153 family)